MCVEVVLWYENLHIILLVQWLFLYKFELYIILFVHKFSCSYSITRPLTYHTFNATRMTHRWIPCVPVRTKALWTVLSEFSVRKVQARFTGPHACHYVHICICLKRAFYFFVGWISECKENGLHYTLLGELVNVKRMVFIAVEASLMLFVSLLSFQIIKRVNYTPSLGHSKKCDVASCSTSLGHFVTPWY